MTLIREPENKKKYGPHWHHSLTQSTWKFIISLNVQCTIQIHNPLGLELNWLNPVSLKFSSYSDSFQHYLWMHPSNEIYKILYWDVNSFYCLMLSHKLMEGIQSYFTSVIMHIYVLMYMHDDCSLVIIVEDLLETVHTLEMFLFPNNLITWKIP